LSLDFDCRAVALEDELRRALKPDVQRLWQELRPRGTIDRLFVSLRFDANSQDWSVGVQAEKLPSRNDAQIESITIRPVWFPYRLDNVTGLIRFHDGVLDLHRVRGAHGETVVDVQGICRFPPGQPWSVELSRFMATGVQFDHDLLAALPRKMSDAVAQLHVNGTASVAGELHFAGMRGERNRLATNWDLTLDIENGRIGKQFPIEHIRGAVRLIGTHDERGARSRGELSIDSMMCKDVQLTRVRGPLWIDPSAVLVGGWVPPPEIGNVPRGVTAEALGGTLSLDARLDTQQNAPFQLECRLREGNLGVIANELNERSSDVKGRAFATLQLSGTNRGTDSWRGKGAARLLDADVYELPIMISLLKILSIKPPSTTAFTNCDLDFRVEGDRIYFDHINFKGDAVWLKGRGEMNLQRQLNLQFYSLVGPDALRPPILAPLFRDVSRSLLLIEVGGTLDNPTMINRPFPQIDETLQRLFPEAANRRNSDSQPPATTQRGVGLDPLSPIR
jgi:hypothetical protein